MCAAMMGYRMILVMPEHLSVERRQTMAAFGAEIVLTPQAGRHGDGARRRGEDARRGQGRDPRPVRQSRQSALALRRHRPRDLARHARRASRISSPAWAPPARSWAARASSRRRIPRSRSSAASPPRARRFRASASGPPEYLPKICDWRRVDRVIEVSQADAEETTRRSRARRAFSPAFLRAARCGRRCRSAREVENAVIVTIICDRGDRYLSTGVFPG